jgi:hypothetical protein
MKLIDLNENVSLSHHQRYVLLQIKLSDTPTLAFERINQSEADIQSRDLLHRLGFIRLSESQAELTNSGERAVTQYGLVDDTGEVTEIGQELLDEYDN